jgi:hypothetical protein
MGAYLQANAIGLVSDDSSDALRQTLVLLVDGFVIESVLSELVLHFSNQDVSTPRFVEVEQGICGMLAKHMRDDQNIARMPEYR